MCDLLPIEGGFICGEADCPDYTAQDARDDYFINHWEIQNDLRDNA